MEVVKKKTGRPGGVPAYVNKEDIKRQLVAWVSEGKTLRDFCRQDGMPGYNALYTWLAEDPVFEGLFARARVVGHDAIADECLALADKEPLEVFDEAGNRRYDPASIAWKKNQIETRLKLLAKWNPKKYGDKTIVAGDADQPVVVQASFDIFGELLKNLSLKRQAGE